VLTCHLHPSQNRLRQGAILIKGFFTPFNRLFGSFNSPFVGSAWTCCLVAMDNVRDSTNEGANHQFFQSGGVAPIIVAPFHFRNHEDPIYR
jgi:hypothetical protein